MASADFSMDTEIDFSDAGAALTYPMEAGQVKKNGYVVLKGFPCKVCDYTTSKPGKHGHAKAHIVAIDIFTGKKYEEVFPTSHTIEVPNVSREEYQLIDIADGYCSLISSKCIPRTDLKLPNSDVGARIQAAFDEGADLMLTVVGAMGSEKIMTHKERV
eukprot:gnl/Hemi2/1487_TR526_c0_g1_i1.p2 gnl/Hemi2/1487_TR526_c0_g1~~gnl/Hemi2/1487_TR526_c0_g1_i1.p2  ORF type:complete len:175 (+),score=72.59 gnl/Hemi2/1487_TR526_c0_g1_i1:49-525(+)